jgi:molybdopterin-guanine dinucleotide biosynthesis protein A
MGGAAKGLLEAPGGGTLLDRWVALLRGAAADVVLVGEHPAYAGHAAGLEVLADDPAGIGPMGGLVALLARGVEGLGAGASDARGRVLAVACDMPFVSMDLVTRLVAAPDAPIVAPRRDGRWEPLFARYDATCVLPAARRRVASGALALQGLLNEAGAVALPLEPRELAELDDWDTPGDRGHRR